MGRQIEMETFNLSPSKLNVLMECEHCFWLKNVKNIDRPRGPFPSLPGGIDRVMKDYFDRFRGALPPELTGKVEGLLFKDAARLQRWRNWRSGLKASYTFKNTKGVEYCVNLLGAIDDLLVAGTEARPVYIPLDYKTKGALPKTDGAEYYQTQLDCYSFMLNENKMPTTGKAYLAYVYPVEVAVKAEAGAEDFSKLMARHMGIDFGCAIFELTADAERAKNILRRAVAVIVGDLPHDSSPTCEYCNFGTAFSETMAPLAKL